MRYISLAIFLATISISTALNCYACVDGPEYPPCDETNMVVRDCTLPKNVAFLENLLKLEQHCMEFHIDGVARRGCAYLNGYCDAMEHNDEGVNVTFCEMCDKELCNGVKDKATAPTENAEE